MVSLLSAMTVRFFICIGVGGSWWRRSLKAIHPSLNPSPASTDNPRVDHWSSQSLSVDRLKLAIRRRPPLDHRNGLRPDHVLRPAGRRLDEDRHTWHLPMRRSYRRALHHHSATMIMMASQMSRSGACKSIRTSHCRTLRLPQRCQTTFRRLGRFRRNARRAAPAESSWRRTRCPASLCPQRGPPSPSRTDGAESAMLKALIPR